MGKITLKKIEPNIGLPGGIVKLVGKGFEPWNIKNEDVNFCERTSWIDAASDTTILTSIPFQITSGEVFIEINGSKSNKLDFIVPETVSTGLHLVDNPISDSSGNIYATYSGSRGESTPVSVYKITPYGEKIVYLQGLRNATSVAINKNGELYVASRFDGKVYRSSEEQEFELFSQGLGVAFGLAFDSNSVLYAGDRGGSVFRLSEDGRADFFASIPQSYISFHLAFDSKDNLYVSNPMHIGENFIYKIDRDANVDIFYSGYSMFHGFCVDKEDNLYVAEAKRKQSRILKINPNGESQVVLTGSNFVGCNLDIEGNLLVASSTAIYKVDRKHFQ